MNQQNDTVPCKFCGNPTKFTDTKLCNNCWEVDCRIDSLLATENGRDFIKEKLTELESKDA